MRIFLLATCLLATLHAVAAEQPSQVMVVGTFHFGNPGRDQHNVEVDDVLQPTRQAQLAEIDSALSRFEPTRVAVEWPRAVVDERYAKFLAGELPPSRNEVVQLGFRVARSAGLARVDGIDVEGEFPYAAVEAWAEANAAAPRLAQLQATVAARVAAITRQQREGTIGAVLRDMNQPAAIARDHAFYSEMLRFGAGDEQPGARLLAAWTQRNLLICARLVQAVRPGDRVVVFYGAGHSHLLRQCVREVPGLRLVEPNDYLPR